MAGGIPDSLDRAHPWHFLGAEEKEALRGRAMSHWYLQYFKNASGLKDLPQVGRGKKSIHCNLNLLRDGGKEKFVPLVGVGGGHAFDQTALPYKWGRDAAGGGTDGVCCDVAGHV
jgi:hypothetical protein